MSQTQTVDRATLAKRARKAREEIKKERQLCEMQPLSKIVCNTYKERYEQRVKEILKVADELYQAKLLPDKYTDPTRIFNTGAWFSHSGGPFDEEESYDYEHLHSVAIFVSNGMEKGIPVHGNKKGFDSDWHVNNYAAQDWMKKFDRFEKKFYRWFDRKYGYTPS